MDSIQSMIMSPEQMLVLYEMSLSREGADDDDEDYAGCTISDLNTAIKSAEFDRVHGIIKAQEISERMEFVNTYDEYGSVPVHYALDPEHTDILQLLLDYGADPNRVDNMKWTSMHFACQKANRKALKLLVWHGADKEIENVQYRKCHLETPGKDEERLACLNFLNATVELLKANLAERLILPCTRNLRSYYRSLFDIMDIKQEGVIVYDEIVPLLEKMSGGNVVGPSPKDIIMFYKKMDVDKNGIVTFPEFLHSVLQDLELKSKGKKKKGKKKK